MRHRDIRGMARSGNEADEITDILYPFTRLGQRHSLRYGSSRHVEQPGGYMA